MTEAVIAIISTGAGAAIATGIMSIIQYKMKRKDTKEDAEDQQSKDIAALRKEIKEVKADVEDLKKHHTEDMEEAHKEHAEELKAIKDELCVLAYAMLAALDGLKQQGCNGNVTEAHGMLSKHLNQQAHGQK